MTSAPVVTDDPYSIDNLVDPYPLFARMRALGGVVFLERYGVHAFFSDATCRRILEDWRTFISGAGVGPSNLHHEKAWRQPGILETDPPDHTVMRVAMTEVISPRSVRRLRKDFSDFARTLVDEIVDRGAVDAITDIAQVYPVRVFGDAVGIPREGRAENLLPLGSMNFATFGPRTELYDRYFRAGAGTSEWAVDNCAPDRLRGDGLGASIWAHVDNGAIDPAQATLLVRAMLSAGIDTTVLAIGNLLVEFARHPDAWRVVREDRTWLRFAIDEMLRHESPFQSFYRTTAAATTVGGVDLAAGEKVALFMGSANRDVDRWGDTAGEFDIKRTAGGHLAFGMGIHQCVGQPISRLELECIFGALADRVAEWEVRDEPEPFVHTTLRGWEHLPVRAVAA
ncbi:cytochrome P450 [Microbacterium sp. RD1]|uniref:cytochrome P450 n=1 Tax=Microbacterium sp. RD1 TaxID=3457313 RepID=UPI003FA59AC1